MVDVAQLVRVPGCGPGGRRFDPDHPPHFLFKILYCIGVSSSGKTQHFDCCIRRFESCHPSHTECSYSNREVFCKNTLFRFHILTNCFYTAVVAGVAAGT